MKYTLLKKYFEKLFWSFINIHWNTDPVFFSKSARDLVSTPHDVHLTEYELLLEDELAVEALTHGLLNLQM